MRSYAGEDALAEWLSMPALIVCRALKTMINGVHKSFKFSKYADQYLGAFAYRFNQRFNLQSLQDNLFGHAATAAPTRERQFRAVAEAHD